MPQTCTVCRHTERAAIDAALLAGTPLRTIADQWTVSKTALIRHRADGHVAEPMVKAKERADVDHGINLNQQLKASNALAWEIATNARQTGDGNLALKALDRVLKQLELVAEIAEQIDRRPQTQVNILLSEDWLRTRAVLVEALRPFPEAKAVVVSRLMALEAADGRSN